MGTERPRFIFKTSDGARTLAATAAVGIAFSSAAVAQEAATSIAGIDEIVVTAQKFQQDLQKVPIAVSVFGSDELLRARIATFEDIALRSPAFSFFKLNKTQVTPALRGASSIIDAAGADQPVAIFLDEVFLGSTGDFELDFFDLERIEILRGPQGTVFGRNSTGGAINVVTTPPSDEFSAVAQGTVGNFGRFDTKGSLTGPLGEGVSGRLAFSSRQSDGWVRNVVSGRKLEEDDQLALRGQLRVQPHDRLDVILAGDWLQDDSFGQQRDLIGATPDFTVVTPGREKNDLDTDGGYDRTISGGSLRVKWDAGHGTLTSVTGYRLNDSSMSQDGDGTPVPGIVLQRAWDISTFTQELRWNSSGDSQLQWLAGIYFFDQSASRVENYGIDADPASFIGTLAGGALNNTRNRIFQDVDTTSYAAFGQLTYAATDRLNLTLGGRYTTEEKDGLSGVSGDPGLFQDDQPFTVFYDESWDAFTPRFGADFSMTPEALLYVTVSRGFKSGGFAVEGSNEDAFSTPFDPEFALSYEVGTKTRWLDDRLQVNTAVYYVDYDDLQVQTIDEGTGRFFVANVGSASSTGVEVELLAQPTPSLRLGLTYAYLDAEFDDFVLAGEDLSGNIPPLSPETTLNGSAEYTFGFAAGDLTVRADYLYKSEIFFDASNFTVPGNLSRFDGVVNASLGFTTASRAWEIVVWGKNLTDEEVALQATPNGVFNLEVDRFLGGEQSYGVVWNEPRTYGVTVTWRGGQR